MRNFLLLSLSILILSCSQRNVPFGLRRTINRIDENLNDTVKYDFKISPETIASNKHHFGLGLNIRNGYKLWRRGLLNTYFRLNGIHHPDDMSGIILTTYHRKLNDNPIKFREQKQHYKSYWKVIKMGQDTLDAWREHMYPQETYDKDKEVYLSNFEPGIKVLGEVNAWKTRENGAAGSGVNFIAEIINLKDRNLLVRITDLGVPREGFELNIQVGDTLTFDPYGVFIIPREN